MRTIGQRDLARMREAGFVAALIAPESDSALLGMSLVSHTVGQMIFNESEPAKAFYFVLSGWVALFREQETGTRAAIHLLGPNESFGEALIDEGTLYPVSAEAATNSELVRIECSGFRERVMAHPQLALAIVAATLAKNKSLVDRILQDQTWTPHRRIAAFLCQLCAGSSGRCEFELPVEQRFIAARLSMSPSTFSRSLGELESVGILARRGKIAIRDIGHVRDFVARSGVRDSQ